MKQNLYVLMALGVVMNSGAIKQRSKQYFGDAANNFVQEDDDDDEPVNLNVDMNQMVKAMSEHHVDLIVSDFDGAPSKHHKHHKAKETKEQKESNNDQ